MENASLHLIWWKMIKKDKACMGPNRKIIDIEASFAKGLDWEKSEIGTVVW